MSHAKGTRGAVHIDPLASQPLSLLPTLSSRLFVCGLEEVCSLLKGIGLPSMKLLFKPLILRIVKIQ